MKKFVIYFLVILAFTLSCRKKDPKSKVDASKTPCGQYQGQQLYKNANGDCFYMGPTGTVNYVEKHQCNC